MTSQLTLLLLQIGFLILLWFFVFAIVYSLRADLFGVSFAVGVVRHLTSPPFLVVKIYYITKHA